LGLLAVAPSTMYQLPEARQQTLSFIAGWMGDVPAFRLDLGSNLSSAPMAVANLLSRKELSRAA
jgi:hypothetical protein